MRVIAFLILYLLHNKLTDKKFIDKLLNKFKRRKNILFLGPSGAGKTTLFNYIVYGRLSNENNKTDISGSHKKISINNQIYQLIDTAGIERFEDEDEGVRGKKYYKSLDNLNNGDILIYMFDANKYLNSREYKEMVSLDFQTLKEFLRNKNESVKVFVIATHLDLLSGLSEFGFENIHRKIYTSVLENFEIIDSHFILGSLIDKKQASNIVSKLNL